MTTGTTTSDDIPIWASNGAAMEPRRDDGDDESVAQTTYEAAVAAMEPRRDDGDDPRSTPWP